MENNAPPKKEWSLGIRGTVSLSSSRRLQLRWDRDPASIVKLGHSFSKCGPKSTASVSPGNLLEIKFWSAKQTELETLKSGDQVWTQGNHSWFSHTAAAVRAPSLVLKDQLALPSSDHLSHSFWVAWPGSGPQSIQRETKGSCLLYLQGPMERRG